MAKKHRDYRTKVIGLGLDPNSPHLNAFEAEGREDKFLAFKSIAKKYPNMAKEEVAEKALLFDKHSAQILDYAVRKKIDLTLEDALSFKEYQKMAFIFAHMNKVDLTLSEAFQITNMDQCNRFKFLIKAGYGKEDALASCNIESVSTDVAVEEISVPTGGLAEEEGAPVEIVVDSAGGDVAEDVLTDEADEGESAPVEIVDVAGDSEEEVSSTGGSVETEDEVLMSGVGAGEGGL